MARTPGGGGRGPGGGPRGGGDRPPRRGRDGGRGRASAGIVIVGDSKGRVGYGSGKAREVPEAIRKATEQARRSLIRVPLREGRTFHHDIVGHYGAGEVVVRAAPHGTGVIAGGPVRAVFGAR